MDESMDNNNDNNILLMMMHQQHHVVVENEVMVMNDHRQKDEAIFGENAKILCADDQRLLQIYVHYELDEDAKVYAKLDACSQEGKSESSNLSDYVYTFKVHYLPPLVLTCLLPKSYPSHQPPFFTITVNWLITMKISHLCSKLDDIWIQQPNQEIIYHWVEWLQNSALTYLGFELGIQLGMSDVVETSDVRAISENSQLELIIPMIISYDKEKHHQVFLSSMHQCDICFNEFAGTEFSKLRCGHIFCWKCMETYSNIHVKEATVNKLSCPDAKCDSLVPPVLLRQLLTNEAYERWESLMLQRTLDSMSDVVYCPRCETACLEDEEHHAQCAKCFFSFCSLCKDRRHLGGQCMTPEDKLRILQERKSSSQLTVQQKRKEQEIINDFLSTREILRNAKQCPSCKMAISKIEGCNKIVCRNCNQLFCYLCNKAISGYDHFNGSCELFQTEVTERQQRWEMRINARQVVRKMQAELHPNLAHPCPICHQVNAKIGNNNHLFCWACQTHYCALCRKIVRRSSEHFGPKGCKQHTMDS